MQKKWEEELQQDTVENENESLPLTDAERSALRGAARPAKGCKCGSLSHDFVNSPKCSLYRDVRQYCEANSIKYQGENSGNERKNTAINVTKPKNSMEKAYIDRFVRLREANAADQEEAEFVLEMETTQALLMKKAVLAPPSLCTLVLSAVASMKGKLDYTETKAIGNGQRQGEKNQYSCTKKQQSKSDDLEESDDDEVLPLNSLVQKCSKRTLMSANLPPPSKRPKKIDYVKAENGTKVSVPSPYFIAEILKHVSSTYGHVFQGEAILNKPGYWCML